MYLYRALLSLVIGLFLTITTASSALAWSGQFDYSWNNKLVGGEFWQSDNDPACPTTNVVRIWTADQTLLIVNNPPNKNFSWLTIDMYTKDCSGHTNQMYLYGDLTKRPADRNDAYNPEEFAQGGGLHVSMTMRDYYSDTLHKVHVNMTTKGGVPFRYTFETDLELHAYEYGVFYGFPTAKASLKINNRPILEDVLNTPFTSYSENVIYIER